MSTRPTDRQLILETPPRVLVAAPVYQIPHFLDLRSDGVPSRVLPLEQEVQQRRNDNLGKQVPEREAVADKVSRTIGGSI